MERMLASPEFSQSERMSRFLQFAVSHTLAGQTDMLKESVIGVHVFDRSPGYDPKADPVVRSEARRLRAKLLGYTHGHPDEPLWIDLPKGGYIPEFHWRNGPSRTTADFTAEMAPPEPNVQAPRSQRNAMMISASGAIILCGAVAGWLASRRAPVYSALDARPFTTYTGSQSSPAFSPDGETLAFSWAGPSGGSTSVWVESVHGGKPRQVTHATGDDSRPVWSPDGRQLAFLRASDKTHGAVYTIDIAGTREQKRSEVLSTVSAVGRVDWSPDGEYLLTSDRDSPATASALTLISLATGEKRRVTAPDPRIAGDTDGAFSPDGQHIAFRRTTSASVEDLYIALMPGRWSRGPAKDAELTRVTFDHRAIGGHAWALDGNSLVVASQRGGSTYSLWRISLSGNKPVRLTEPGINAVRPVISKRGNRLAYESIIFDSNIWQLAIANENNHTARGQTGKAGSAAHRVIDSTMAETSPQFSPDGARIAFRSNRSGSDEIWMAQADGSESRQMTHFDGPLTGSPRWSPDGRQLVFDSREAGNPDIYILPAGGGSPRRFTTEASSEVVPSWSRDGRSIYFASDRTGKWQVWKQPVAAGPAQRPPKMVDSLPLNRQMDSISTTARDRPKAGSGGFPLLVVQKQASSPTSAAECGGIGRWARRAFISWSIAPLRPR